MSLDSRRIRTAALAIATLASPLGAQTGTLVVLNKGAASASIIDVTSGETLAALPTGDGPHEVVISGDGRLAVGADYGGSTPGQTLTVIDVPGLAVARTIGLGRYTRPHGLAFMPGDSIVAVTSETTAQVVFVRIADGTIVRTVPTGQQGSHMLAMPTAARRIYTSNGRDHTVSELDLEAGRPARTIPVPPRPEAIGVTPDGSEVWVGSNEEGTVSVIDTRRWTVREAATGFTWPYRVLFTPDQALVLIPDLQGNELRFFDRASRRQIGLVAFPEAGPQGITLNTDGTAAFQSLSREGRVAVIDVATREVVRYLATGAGPDGIAYTERTVADGGAR